jgi:hypothetical protein
MFRRSEAIDETRWNRNVHMNKAQQTYKAFLQSSVQIQECPSGSYLQARKRRSMSDRAVSRCRNGFDRAGTSAFCLMSSLRTTCGMNMRDEAAGSRWLFIVFA